MAGIDNNVAIIGDWVPPSPSPGAFFSPVLGDDITSRTTLDPHEKNRTEGFIFGSQGQMVGGNSNKDVPHTVGAPLTELGSLSGNKSSSRGGLVERMAARAGFNAPRLNTQSIRSAELSLNPEILSPYLSIPPGLSPTTLLESPVFLSNSLAQPSPTTGKFSFVPNGSNKSSGLITEPPDRSNDNMLGDFNSSSFEFKPVTESTSSFFLGATSKINPSNVPHRSCPSIEVSIQSENPLSSHVVDQTKLRSQSRNIPDFQAELSRSTPEKDDRAKTCAADVAVFDRLGDSVGQSPPVDGQQDVEGDRRASGDSVSAGVGVVTPSDDGYNWRKYGQKQVKGSEYPRSYYKCTHPNCPVKKKVERSLEGHITEIIYKGAHIHPKPSPNRQTAISSSNPLMDMQLDFPDQTGPPSATDNDPILNTAQKGTAAEWRHENVEVTSLAPAEPEFGNPSSSVLAQSAAHLEVGDAGDASSTFSNDEDEDDRATHASVGYDGDGDEFESKRRKIESYASEMGGTTKAVREPRVVVQTTSEVDILDDGYRWRKYGQKVVKGNPNPRSYYKCTNAGCAVRKHVERASHDLKSVITTYEGKHNHDVPAARNSSQVNSNSNAIPVQRTTAVQSRSHRPEPSQVHNRIPRFEGSTPFGSFSLPGRQQLGPSPSFSFGMNQTGLMAGLRPGGPKIPVMPVHSYLAQQCPVNQMEFVLPKGEPKMEPVAEPSLNMSTNPSVYQQIMSRMPLGPQM